MTVDSYAPCPCGSGKKMKFCKCVDQPQEYEKIKRLIEGEQSLAAMDRINQLLADTPNAAWLLAMKGELALQLQEPDTFRDTATRFLKLKPDNPLAITMRAFLALMDKEPLENVARYLCDALAESRHSLHYLTLQCIMSLNSNLAHSPYAPLRFFWTSVIVQLSQNIEDFDPSSAISMLVTDNLLSESGVTLPPVPTGVSWSERANEVIALTQNNRYAQAEGKLRTILRDFPDQPWPLMQLLQVQMILLDQEGSTNTARKLSSLRDLDEATRDRFAAIALDIEPHQKSICVPSFYRYVEVESDEAVHEALLKLGFIEILDPEATRSYAEQVAFTLGDEIVPKHMYRVRTTRTAAGHEYQCDVGTIALFARQTDKPARAWCMIHQLSSLQSSMEQIDAAFQAKSTLVDPSLDKRRLHYLHAVDTPRPALVEGDDARQVPEWAAEAFADSFLNTPLNYLDGKTVLEANASEPMREKVRAVLVHYENACRVRVPRGSLDIIYQRLELTRRKVSVDGLIDRSLPQTEIPYVSFADVPSEKIGRAIEPLVALQYQRYIEWAALEICSRAEGDVPLQYRVFAWQFFAQVAETPERRIFALKQILQLIENTETPIGVVVVQLFNTMISVGRGEEAMELFVGALKKHPRDPYLNNLAQTLMQEFQPRGGVDHSQVVNRMLRADAEPATTASGLVLPGQEPGSSSESGKSKLWLPD